MMYIVDGRLCKSKHFDAANFGLKTAGTVDTFLGNMSVKISSMRGRPRNVHIRLPPPQAKVISDSVVHLIIKTGVNIFFFI